MIQAIGTKEYVAFEETLYTLDINFAMQHDKKSDNNFEFWTTSNQSKKSMNY